MTATWTKPGQNDLRDSKSSISSKTLNTQVKMDETPLSNIESRVNTSNIHLVIRPTKSFPKLVIK